MDVSKRSKKCLKIIKKSDAVNRNSDQLELNSMWEKAVKSFP